ncbi:MAG: ATP-dependent Clp protease proteolytic subunit [Planctomycetes bacterium]|nr:ATP-dependent Clp protease proteolytic subunit [Planctomycetota bacterium]
MRACTDLSNKGVGTIYVLLSTPGGSVTNGIHIYNVLRALPSKVIMHNVAAVNSIGNVIFLAGEERYASPSTTFMYHGVGFDVQGARFEERMLRERLDSISLISRRLETSSARAPTSPTQARLMTSSAGSHRDTAFAKDRGIIHDVREACAAAHP